MCITESDGNDVSNENDNKEEEADDDDGGDNDDGVGDDGDMIIHYNCRYKTHERLKEHFL